MSGTPYRCECQTCQQSQIAESYPVANEFFTAHATEGHEVEIVRVELSANPPE